MKAEELARSGLQFAALARRNPVAGYSLAAALFAIALVLRFMIADNLPAGFPFLTFFPAVMLTAFFGGTRPAIMSAILSTFAAWFWFVEPAGTFGLDVPAAVAVGFFVVIIAVDISIIHVMALSLEQSMRAREAADRVARDNERMADQQRTLFQELQHRVANNLAFVAALLSIHQRRLSDMPEAAAALKDARVRLETLAKVHRRLYDPDNADLALTPYFEDLCADIMEASGRKDVRCTVQTANVPLEVERLTTLSLIVMEVVTNSLKHAFNDGRAGEIGIALDQIGSTHLQLTIRDNGDGLPADLDPAASKRLGFRILNNFAKVLDAELTFSNSDGAVTRLTFPIARRDTMGQIA